MKFLSNSFLYIFVAFLCSAARAAVVESSEASIDLDMTGLNQNYKYQMTITRVVTPKKMSGNPFRDSYLQVTCGDLVLGKNAQRISPSSFGKDMTFQVVFEVSNQICPTFNFHTTLETNGTIVDSPRLTYDYVQLRETVPYFVKRVQDEMPMHMIGLVKAHSLMSSVSGSQESFHCLIVSFESDALIPIESIDEIKGEYRKLYGTFQKDAIQCPATGILADRIAACSIAENKFTLFCMLYDRVLLEAAWFTAAIAKGEAIIAEESDAGMIGEINALLEKIKKSKEAVESQFGA